MLDEARRLPGVRLAAGTLVFPSVRGTAVPEAAFVQMLRRLRIDATAHGFRASFRTWVAERTSTPREVCEAALAHSLSDLERRYQRGAQLEQRRVLMERWASWNVLLCRWAIWVRSSTFSRISIQFAATS